MSKDSRAELIARYRSGVDAVRDALDGATPEDLDLRAPEVDAWSARQVVHHLADSETNSYLRLRRLIADEGTPQIQGYDEAGWAKRLDYSSRPIEASLAVFVAVRAASSELLESMGDQIDWSRAGIHSESGAYTADDWLRIYVDHGHDHADQIRRAREGRA
jgi:DinB superfamily